MADAVWAQLAEERRRLAAYVATLGPEAWTRPTLCPDWTVKHIVAHLIASAKSKPLNFALGLAKAGFNFDRFTSTALATELHGTPADMSARFTKVIDLKTIPGKALLGEVVVHSEDIRLGLGTGHGDYPVATLLTIAEYFRHSGPPIRARKRLEGLSLRANDVEWTVGDGPVVAGPLLSLVLAMTGRKAGLAELTGPGVELLTSRM